METQPETAHFTRVQTPQIPELLQRAGFLEHHKHVLLGAGSFAQVHQTVDLSTGDLLAVKTISFDSKKPLEEKRKKELYKREVELHSHIYHVSLRGCVPKKLSSLTYPIAAHSRIQTCARLAGRPATRNIYARILRNSNTVNTRAQLQIVGSDDNFSPAFLRRYG